MSTSVELHIRRYPNCRATSIACKIKQDETTEKLRQEILQEKSRRTPVPWWRRALKALRGEVNG